MKKDILNDCIKNLGIEEGDVIKICYGDDYTLFYRYINKEFKAINKSCEDNMSDDEVYDLLTGRDFEIVAKGNTSDYKQLEKKIDELLTYKQNETKEKELQKEKDKKFITILSGVWLGLILVYFIIKSIIGF